MMTLDKKVLADVEAAAWEAEELGQATSIGDNITAYLEHPNSGWVERRKYDDMVRTALRDNGEARAQIAALREALEQAQEDICARWCDKNDPHVPHVEECLICTAVLTDTAKAAAQWVRVDDEHVVMPVVMDDEMAEAWATLALDRIKRRMKDDNDCKGAVEGAKESYKAIIAVYQKRQVGHE